MRRGAKNFQETIQHPEALPGLVNTNPGGVAPEGEYGLPDNGGKPGSSTLALEHRGPLPGTAGMAYHGMRMTPTRSSLPILPPPRYGWPEGARED